MNNTINNQAENIKSLIKNNQTQGENMNQVIKETEVEIIIDEPKNTEPAHINPQNQRISSYKDLFSSIADRIGQMRGQTAKIKELADEQIKASNQKTADIKEQMHNMRKQLNKRIKEQNLSHQQKVHDLRQKHKEQMDKLSKLEKLIKDSKTSQDELNELINSL